MKDFDRWNVVKKQINIRQENNLFKAGQIWWCKLGLNIGSEQDGSEISFERPVLVLRKYTSNTFLGLPLTTKIKKGSYYFSLNRKNVVILSQSRVLDSKRLMRDMHWSLSRKQIKIIKGKVKKLI